MHASSLHLSIVRLRENNHAEALTNDARDEDYLVAVARLQDLSPEFKIDLIAMERCKPELRDAITKGGKLL